MLPSHSQESFVTFRRHTSSPTGTERLCEAADDHVDETLERLARVPPTLLGVRAAWVRAAIDSEVLKLFRQLPTLFSPYQKVVCLRDTVRELILSFPWLRCAPCSVVTLLSRFTTD